MLTFKKNDVQCSNLPLVSDSTLPKADQMRLGESIQVELADGLYVTIPKGFITDLFSVPPWLHSLFKPYDNKLNLAAVVHDYLYEQWEEFIRQNDLIVWNHYWSEKECRLYADNVLLEIMLRYRQNRTLYAFYYAVRLGGAKNWKFYRNRNKK